MVTIRKKEKETFLGLLRRFTKKIKESGILEKVKERRFRERPLSKKKKKVRALHRLEYRKKMARLKKLGKI